MDNSACADRVSSNSINRYRAAGYNSQVYHQEYRAISSQDGITAILPGQGYPRRDEEAQVPDSQDEVGEEDVRRRERLDRRADGGDALTEKEHGAEDDRDGEGEEPKGGKRLFGRYAVDEEHDERRGKGEDCYAT